MKRWKINLLGVAVFISCLSFLIGGVLSVSFLSGLSIPGLIVFLVLYLSQTFTLWAASKFVLSLKVSD